MAAQAKKDTAGKSTGAARSRQKGSKAIKDLDVKRGSGGVKGGGNSGSDERYFPAGGPK
jgi:hypothetical protein